MFFKFMKKFLLYTLIPALVSCVSIKHKVVSQEYGSPDFMEQEVIKTKNPTTGKVNPADLVHAYFQKIERFKPSAKLDKREIYPTTWRAVDDNMATLAISKIVYNPLNTNEFYFCTGEGWFNADAARGMGVWKSTDAGKTWSVLPSTLNDSFYYCQDMLIHPTTGYIFVATREGGLQQSKDGGNTWNKVLGAGKGAIFDRIADLELTADGEFLASIGLFQTDGIYYSATGEEGTWEKRMNGIPSGVHRIEMATAPADANVVYCIPTSSGADRKITGIYRSNDKGKNWIELSLPGGDKEFAKVQGWYDLIISVDPNNADIAVAGGLNLWRTRDGGKNWQQLAEGDMRVKSNLQYVHVDQHEIVFKNSDTILFGNDGGVWMSTNFGDDNPVLFDANKNYNVTQYYAVAMAPHSGDQRVVGGAQDNGSYISTENGVSDFKRVSWADGGFCAIQHENGNVIYTTTQERRIYRTRNGVVDTITNPMVKDANVLFINPLEMDATDPEMIYQGSNQGLWRLKNASFADSTTWELATRPFGQISAIASSKNKPLTVFVGRTNGGKVFRVDNVHITDKNTFPVNLDGRNQLPTDVYTSCVAVSQNNAAHALVVYSNYGVNNIYETNNALNDTANWTACDGDLPDMPVRWAIFHPDNEKVCYIATELGLWFTENLDGSNTKWKPCGVGLPNLRVDMIRYRQSDKTFVIGTHGRGIFTAQTKPGSYEFEYTERGPRNIGGRTRTLMYDPNDPSGKRVWAGSVSGGLWVTDNIDSVAYWYPAISSISIQLYPNPALFNKTSVYVASPAEITSSIKLYDTKGAFVHEIFNGKTIGEKSYEIDLGGLADEFYIVEVVAGGEKKSFKVVNR